MSGTLLKEIRNIALIAFVLCVIQVIVTVPLGYFGYPAILGTLLGYGVAMLNFTLMGIILEKSISRKNGASGLMGFGYIARLAIIGAAVVWAMKADYLNYVCAVIPLIFPQISIFILNRIRKQKGKRRKNERT